MGDTSGDYSGRVSGASLSTPRVRGSQLLKHAYRNNCVAKEFERVRITAQRKRKEAARERQEYRDRFAALEIRSVSPRVAPPVPFPQLVSLFDPLTANRSSGEVLVVSDFIYQNVLQIDSSLATARVTPPAVNTAPRILPPVSPPIPTPVALPPVQ